MDHLDPGSFLADLRRRGVYVTARDGQLKVEAPRSAMTPELQQTLRDRKDKLLAHLANWNQKKACQLLEEMQARLTWLLGGRPMPQMTAETKAAYARLAEAQDRRDWPAFLEALSAFETSWRPRIRCL